MSEGRKLGWTFDVKGLGSAVSKLSKIAAAWSKIKEQVKGASEELKGSAQRSKIDLDAWGESFKKIGAAAGSFFNRMVANSPALGLEFAKLGFATDLLAMSLGEALAPVIEPIVDGIIKMLEFVQQLPEPFRIFIGVIIGLTVVMTLLIPVIIGIQTAGLPLIIIILAIIVVIAAIIAIVILVKNHWKQWLEAIINFWNKWKKFIVVLLLIFAPFLGIIALIVFIVQKFGLLGKALDLLKRGWALLKEAIAKKVAEIIAKVRSFVNILKDAWAAMISFFIMKFEEFKNKILEIWRKVKGPIEDIANAAKGAVDKTGDVLRDTGDYIGFERGGIMPFTGLATLHAGERVLNVRETRAFEALRSGVGGSTGGSPAGTAGAISIANEISIEGGIFTDTRQIDDLVDMLSERILEKILRGISV